MTGPYRKSLPELLEDTRTAAHAIADARVDLIVFHCTSISMAHGPEGDANIVETIARETGIPTLSTGQAVTDALRALAIKRLVLVTPYQPAVNAQERDYLRASGFEVVHDVALALAHESYTSISPARWVEITRENTRDDADGYFLSCTNTTQIEAVAALEETLGKPVANSNQAALWAALGHVGPKLEIARPIAGLGRLMSAA
jgi:maleate cis-trans isomerase